MRNPHHGKQDHQSLKPPRKTPVDRPSPAGATASIKASTPAGCSERLVELFETVTPGCLAGFEEETSSLHHTSEGLQPHSNRWKLSKVAEKLPIISGKKCGRFAVSH
ncbi:hypothetical protein GOP47_0019702 [Adiantum capillus-veneris]|uniref:Uncharacterized protein n=1 Tax=Adiantum capillus-veneris TaxID=13818 RepID=A0A9D4UCA2_ADICA|nr:hypothetical protein GOP47_0019702 [Adiantum capillus-veneris]